jgi:hypothetical protein
MEGKTFGESELYRQRDFIDRLLTGGRPVYVCRALTQEWRISGSLEELRRVARVETDESGGDPVIYRLSDRTEECPYYFILRRAPNLISGFLELSWAMVASREAAELLRDGREEANSLYFGAALETDHQRNSPPAPV